VKQAGDGHLAAFAVPSDAMRAALAINRGIGVHVAARTTAAAQPGELLVTESVPALVAGSGFAFDERGTHQLKGIPGDWRFLALTG